MGLFVEAIAREFAHLLGLTVRGKGLGFIRRTRGFLRPQVAKLSNLNVYPDGPPTNPDPHFYRTGLPPPKEVADIILRTCAEAKEALSHKKV